MDIADAELLALYHELGSYQAVANALDESGRWPGVHRTSIMRRVVKYQGEVGDKAKPLFGGRAGAHKPVVRELPAPGEVKRYILSVAQNNTRVHEPAIDALELAASHYDAEILVSTVTYNRNAWAKASEKRDADRSAMADQSEQGNDVDWFDPRVEPYVSEGDRDIQLAPTLVWVGRANIIPTAPKPLNGWESYTGEASAIFPHMRQHLRSVATSKHKPAKFLYSTGTVTRRNYIERSTGLRADFNHVYGGLIVEVRSDGSWFVRQIRVDRDGLMYDLDLVFDTNLREVYEHDGVAALQPGDLHAPGIEEMVVGAIAEDEGNMLDTLRPSALLAHDSADFRARNHHDRGDPHQNFAKHVAGEESVATEIRGVADTLARFWRPDVDLVVVDSNHDQALTRWLREADYRYDPVNAIFFLDAQSAVYKAIYRADRGFHVLEWAIRYVGCTLPIRFLRQDESYILAGVEHGMHGDLGPNGSRGNPMNLSKLDVRANVGHYHSCAIVDGLYAAGMSGHLNQGYAKGPSSWSHSHIVTYPNGKRAIVTQVGRAWRA